MSEPANEAVDVGRNIAGKLLTLLALVAIGLMLLVWSIFLPIVGVLYLTGFLH